MLLFLIQKSENPKLQDEIADVKPLSVSTGMELRREKYLLLFPFLHLDCMMGLPGKAPDWIFQWRDNYASLPVSIFTKMYCICPSVMWVKLFMKHLDGENHKKYLNSKHQLNMHFHMSFNHDVLTINAHLTWSMSLKIALPMDWFPKWNLVSSVSYTTH